MRTRGEDNPKRQRKVAEDADGRHSHVPSLVNMTLKSKDMLDTRTVADFEIWDLV